VAVLPQFSQKLPASLSTDVCDLLQMDTQKDRETEVALKLRWKMFHFDILFAVGFLVLFQTGQHTTI
jgi:hypothetical protein